jgi:hypothetical protein
MLRRIAFVAVLLAAGLFAGESVPDHARAQDKPTLRQPQFVHTVIFYLKSDAPKDAAEGLIKDAHELLTKIPTVRGIKVGRPSTHGSEEFAKKDFQVALLVMFDDATGLKPYLEHPLHLKYVERNGKSIDMSKLLVYDFANQEK